MKENDVHIYGPSFSTFVRSVALVCHEKSISYQTGFEIKGRAIPSKSIEHYQIHPFGKLPVLLHQKLILPETASICRYLDKNFAGRQLQPADNNAAALHDAACAHISIDIDKAIVRDYLLEYFFPKGEQGAIRYDMLDKAKPQAINALKVVSTLLAQGNALNGKYISIADALLAPMLHYLTMLPPNYSLLSNFPEIERYLAQLMTHHSCMKVLVMPKTLT